MPENNKKRQHKAVPVFDRIKKIFLFLHCFLAAWTEDPGRSPDLRVNAFPTFSMISDHQWHITGLLFAYSGGTVQDFHLLPF